MIIAQNDSVEMATCHRNMVITAKNIEVTILINKPVSGGFARIYEKLPQGASVTEVKCGSAYFKTEKSMLKIAWDDIPSDKQIEINYKLKLSEPVSDTSNAVSGTFSAEFLAGSTDIIPILAGKKEYVKETILASVEIKNNKEKELPVEIKAHKQPLASDASVYICIQVAAVGKNINADYLKSRFGYEGEFESHFEENIYRITVGKFNTINEAETAMKEYKNSFFKKCFLSAYKNGNKIPIYEAEKLLN